MSTTREQPTLENTMPGDQLLGLVRERMAVLRPLAEEHDRLAEALAAIDDAVGNARA